MGSNGEQNKTYQATNFSKQEILSNHKSVLSSYGISSSDKDNDIPLLYLYLNCTNILLNNALLQDHLLNCSAKSLSKLLTIILFKIKDDLKRYTDTRNCVN